MWKNLTPHHIRIAGLGKPLSLPPSGEVASVSISERDCLTIDGIPVIQKTSRVEGLPQPSPTSSVNYIVSNLVLAHVPDGRSDVYAPDNGETAVRNQQGHIIAITRLIRP